MTKQKATRTENHFLCSSRKKMSCPDPAVSPTRPMTSTKQDQIDRQYKPFQKLARQAAQLEEKYGQEIRDIRSPKAKLSSFSNKELACPTQALALVGVFLVVEVVSTILASHAGTIEIPGEEFWREAASKVLNKVGDASAFPTTTATVAPMGVEPPVALVETLPPQPDPTAVAAPYSLKDFSKLDFYGSSEQVESWFFNKK